ncbi:PREDICTED: small subunit processome component 20 homolog [Habropoda laboriosa]|uniref:small subunit processome component 20 homolog n=1 Tax=Habropoda laboriosa TaxID=597456 RepID=UPI00083DA270|nr:PREDICTED: small subunit processome component 20 homolog [Habropoda laboriosa]
MKNKPTRHKELNTFQFKSFSERVSEIDVDVFHRVAHRNEENNEEIETYFHETLQKWNYLNLTEGYSNFKKKVRNIITLPQLVNQKQFVIDTLIEYLEKKDVLFLQPILELVVAVSKDLQKDFYEYFPKFLTIIVDLLQTKDTEQIEYTFTSLAYLFKFLWRYLVKNVKTVLDLLLPLLADTQPAYINSFAAESFAFVARKIKDKDSFLKTILHILKNNPNGVPGCSKLLFEIVSGTPGLFHSCAEQMLSLYINALNNEHLNQNIIFELLKEIFNCLLQNIHPQKCQIFWSVFLNVTDISIEKTKHFQPTVEREKSLVLMLQLLKIVIIHKNGKFVMDPALLIRKLVQILDTFENENDVLQESINVSVAILLADNVKLMQETSSQVLFKIMAVKDIKLLYKAVESLIHYSSFETLVLPHIIRHSISTNFNHDTLQLFSKIVKVKALLCINGISLNKWTNYILDIRGAKPESISYFKKKLEALLDDNVSTNALKMLIILPHLKPLPEKFRDILKKGILSLYKRILNNTNTESDMIKLCLTFLIALESAIHIFEPEILHKFLEINDIKILDLITKYPDNKFILNATDLCITYFSTSEYQEMYVNQSVFDNLKNSIAQKLSSPFGDVRLVVTHLYSLFANVKAIKSSIINTETVEKSVMEHMYLAESEPITVQNYRSRLLHLQALSFENNAVTNLDFKYYELPLRYLLGNMYINFSLLWNNVSQIIASYANKQCEPFWPIFLDELKRDHTVTPDYKPSFECEIISEIETSIQKSNDNPDYENHEILLWKCMSSFSQFCETKNRDITGLFIDFVNDNFFKTNSEDAKCCSILKMQEANTDNEMEIDAQSEDDSESEEKEEKEEKETISPISTKLKQKESKQVTKFILSRNYKVKLLIAQLEIFEKITNPKTLYRESEMQKIYLDLLSSKNSDIQKGALNCLLTYKYKYLLPYKTNLLGLIDEKNLKTELTRFKIDQESNMIQNEHREELIPILMRIIYAKMVTKIGMRTGGKAGGAVRRKMILRFLAGTQEDEMIIFTKMAFKPFKRFMSLEMNEKVNLKQLTQKIIDTVDLSNVIPPKRLQSAINLLGILIEQCGSKMGQKLLPFLLRLVICILAEVTGILQRSDRVYVGFLTSIRNVRTSCILILTRFFNHFEDYAWNDHEVDALFNVAVFPQLEKLPMEGIHSPTPLLKLMMSWSQNSRYYPLFIKYRDDDKSVSPLPYVMRLLLGPKTHASVINAILEMIQKMVTLQDYGKINENDMEVDTAFVPLTPMLNNLLEINEEAVSNGVNYGSTILLPHVFSILEYIKNKLQKSNRGINKTELVILSRISEFVKDADASDVLLTLTLPILTKKAGAGEAEDTIMELITTVINLTKQVKNPIIHIRAILPLLGVITTLPARRLLLELYKIIVEKSSEDDRETLMKNYNLLSDLNAWDRRWIDQPDFQKRLDAFSEINNAIEKNEITLEFGIAIIYNCYYFLKNEGDLALRDNAGQCLKVLGCKLAKEHKGSIVDRRYLMDDTILALIRRGITAKNEFVKLQSIAFLGHMAMECADVHPVLRDLSLLTNKMDPEVDFFENMQHLQLHRRARALLKFCSIVKSLKKTLNPRTLTQFIFPLASSYLCNEAFAHKNSIVDAAIEAVGTVCKLLPWHQYEVILKHYLDKLRGSIEFQKQLVRIIVIILDSFHFNLSKYTPIEGSSDLKAIKEVSEKEAVSDEKKEDDKNVEENIDDKNIEQDVGEKLDEVLNSENIDNVAETVESVQKETQEEIPVVEKQTILSQYRARRVVFSISKQLLPQLHRSIVARTSRENSHKINKKRVAADNEEEELMRVPIALAFVKLLQKLPEHILEINLPGIFMKLCTFLKSRLDSVRRVTREILQKIMITLGPKYLNHLLREMNTLLTKGFQVHVLAYTVQAVLVALKPYYQKFDINNSLQSILSVCKVDLFGLSAEEKEVIGIVRNVSEAKSTKSFDIFHILAEYITESCLVDLIMPLKEVLMKTHSYKTIQKVVECLRNIVLGLADNTFIALDQMLIFLYGVVSKSIPEFMPEKNDKQLTEKQVEVLTRYKSDCFIIPPEPKNKMGIKVASKTSKNTNVHVIVEFGLKLFHILLKRDKISNKEFKPLIEPFIPLISECLKSQHVKLSTLSLQCLSWLLKMNLSLVQETISDICESIFSILHKYAAASLSKGDNFDLVMAGFKCMSVIVRDVKNYTITTDQLKALIMYAEQDMHDTDKRATAFGLLKSIIARKMILPEMYLVMEKVAALSVTSELEHVRLQSRSVFYSYLMEYPLGKHVNKHVAFYLTQLSYEMQPGRLSALEMLHSIITGFPLKTLIAKSSLIFIMAGARLINDDDPTCRKLCAKCIKEMITRIPHNERSKLFDIVVAWLKDIKVTHRTLAAQLCGIFVTVEKDTFESRLKEILPFLVKQFHPSFNDDDKPGRFVKLRKPREMRVEMHRNIKNPERMRDHHMFQVLQLLLKVSANCTAFLKNEEHKEAVCSFAEYSQSLLAHPHSWVRLAASQMIGFILAALDVDKIIYLLENPEKCETEINYIYQDPITTIRSLTLDLIAQLQPDLILEDLADQAVKNLIFIARILKSVKTINTRTADQEDDIKHTEKDQLSLSWVVKKLRKAVNVEIVKAPQSIVVRIAYFKWVAGVVATISMEYLNVALFNIMSPIVREISLTEDKNVALRRLAKEAATMIKKRLGIEEYNRLLSKIQQKLDIKKAERKKIRTQQFVTDPELAAKRKIAKQQKKKEAKKRKLDTIRGKKVMKKRPKKEVDLDVI